MSNFLWTQTDDVGPSARYGHAICFDAPRARALLFGGRTETSLVDDTWQLSASGWTQIGDTGPSARECHAMCFDAAAGAAVLFGGLAGGQASGDTWLLKEADWTQVEDTGPTARFGHGLAFDEKSGRTILFGGSGLNGVANDTWRWNTAAGKWTQIGDTGPSPRRFHCMAYDLVNEKVVLFGGEAGDGTPLGDTWVLTGDVWTQVAHFGAPACLRAAMIGSDVGLVLFGGVTAGPHPELLSGTWRFGGRFWTQRQDIGPSGRLGHAMTFDGQRRTVILFGGRAPQAAAGAVDLLFADTWEHVEAEPSLAPATGSGQGPQGGGPTVSAVTAQPNPVQKGGQVTVNVSLDSASSTTTVVQIAWMLESVFNSSNNSGQPPQPGDMHLLPPLQIPAGLAQGTVSFAAPAVNEPSIVVLAATENNVVGAFLLTIN